AGDAAGVVSATLTGSFDASLEFSQDATGFGALGTVEMGFGKVDMSTPAGVDMVQHSGNSCALVKTDPFATTEAPGSLGQANLLTGTFSIDLHTAFAYTTEVQNTCGEGFTTTTVLDGSSAPPTFPLRMDGVMKISPALTADGHFRLARMVISG